MTTNHNKPHHIRFSPKLIAVVSTAVIILAMAVYLIIFFVNRPSSEATETDQFISDITQEVIEAIGDDKDYQAGIDKWDQYILSETDDATLAKLYDARADQLYSYYSGDESELLAARILADVYAAEAVNPTGSTAMSIYIYEGCLGDEDVAQQYHEAALERDPEFKAMMEGGQG